MSFAYTKTATVIKLLQFLHRMEYVPAVCQIPAGKSNAERSYCDGGQPQVSTVYWSEVATSYLMYITFVS